MPRQWSSSRDARAGCPPSRKPPPNSGPKKGPLLLPQRPKQLRAGGREVVFRLDSLSHGGRERDLGVAELDDAAHAGLVATLRELEPFGCVLHHLFRCRERSDRSGHRELGLLDLQTNLLA